MKKVTVFLLVIAMLMSFAMPAFAEDSYAQNLYDAYCDLKNVCETGDLAELKESYEKFEEAFYTGDDDLTAEEQTEFAELMGTANYDDAYEMIWDLDETASAVLDLEEVYNAFADDPNEETAMAYVYGYEYAVVYGESEEAKSLVKKIYNDAEALYQQALDLLPANDIDAVCAFYEKLSAALEGSSLKELEDVYYEGEDFLETIGMLTAAEFEKVAEKIGAADAAEASERIDEATGNALSLIGFQMSCELFEDDPNEDNARMLVSEYEMLADPDFSGEQLSKLFKKFFPDAEKLYQEALKAIPATDVQAVYEAYQKMLAAWDKGTLAALREAEDAYDLLSEKVYLMNEAEFAEFCSLLGTEDEWEASEKIDEALGEYTDTILYMDELIRAFEEDPSAVNALDLRDEYDWIFNDPGMEDEDERAAVRKYFPNIDEIYQRVQDAIPEADPQVVYDGYKKLSDALEKRDPELLKAAIDELEVTSLLFNLLSEEDLEELAKLMGAEDGDEAFGMFLGAVGEASVAMNAISLSETFAAEPNKQNAVDFIGFYDVLFNVPEYESKELRALILEFCPNIHDIYAEAVKIAPDAVTDDEFTSGMEEEDPSTEQSPPENNETTPEPEEEKKDPNIPQTGDDSSIMLFALIALIGIAGAIIAGRKIKTKE